jgi:hypothetical protein
MQITRISPENKVARTLELISSFSMRRQRILVALTGEIGNLLFQFAAARSIEIPTGVIPHLCD